MSDYREQWRQYRRLRMQMVLAFAGYAPFCFAVAMVSIAMFQTFTPAFVAAALWMGLFAYVGSRVTLWRCPRCGKCFSGSWWYNTGVLARQCVHCGLRKFEIEDGSLYGD
jgi:hypothetical protein